MVLEQVIKMVEKNVFIGEHNNQDVMDIENVVLPDLL